MANDDKSEWCCSESILLKAHEAYSGKSEERAREIAHILKRFTDPSESQLLDLGCGPGNTTAQFVQYAREVVGLDISIAYARQGKQRQLQMIVADARHLPCQDKAFGVIVCNDVLEHVNGPGQVIQEITRVMTEDGVAFVQCANRYQVIEPHFLLPFLSWLPIRLANIYLRLTDRGTSYEDYHPLTRGEIDLLFQGHNAVHLTRERALKKIKMLDIGSPLLRRVISATKRILSEETLADLVVPFSVHTLVLLKRSKAQVDHEPLKTL